MDLKDIFSASSKEIVSELEYVVKEMGMVYKSKIDDGDLTRGEAAAKWRLLVNIKNMLKKVNLEAMAHNEAKPKKSE